MMFRSRLRFLAAAAAVVLAQPPPATAEKPASPNPESRICRPCLDIPPERRTPLARNPINEFDKIQDWEGPYAFACGDYFAVAAHSIEVAAKACRSAERLYPTVLSELGLAHPEGQGLYPISIYADREEYHRKTNSPDWSNGQSYWNVIRTFDSWRLDRVLAHELTHLTIAETFQFRAPEVAWLAEGLADMMEWASASEWERGVRDKELKAGPADPMPFAEMEFYRWGADRRTHLRWHLQVASVVRFLKDECGMEGVRALLKAHADGMSPDGALAAACPGRRADISGFEVAWRMSIATYRQAAVLASR